MPATDPAGRQPLLYLVLYALAWAGGSIAYVPFLTILLPLKVSAMAGADAVRVLAYITFCGAVAASVGNILFGWLSDHTRRRRSWIAAGLLLNIGILLLGVPNAERPGELIALIVLWQLALNMMLGPLSAWAGDWMPRGQMGLLGGMLAFAPALGALSGVVVTLSPVAGAQTRLALVAVMVAACVGPALLFARPKPMSPPEKEDGPSRVATSHRVIATMWSARLLVQIAEAALFAFLLLYFRSLEPAMAESRVARLFGGVLAFAVPVALMLGYWADRHRRPILPLAVTAALSAGGLVAMGLSRDVDGAIAGYVLFGMATSVFLSLHSGQTLRVLPRPQRRGLDLGLFNLTNTAPSLIMPWLTLTLVPAFGFAGLFGLLAVLALLAAILLAMLPRFD